MPESDLPEAPWRDRWRGRLGLVLAALLVAAWVLPWAEVTTGRGIGRQVGAQRTGVAGALALLAIWGLSATWVATTSRRGLRIGVALTDAAVAGGAALLLALEHPWFPFGAIRGAWMPIFAPLALLALLDVAVLAWGRRPVPEVGVLRAGAALFAATALAVDRAWIPAGLAAYLALSPLLLGRARDAESAGRRMAVLLAAAGAAALWSPSIHASVGALDPAGVVWFARHAWTVLAAALVVLAVDGAWRPRQT